MTDSSATGSDERRPVGRPRLHSAETERRLIFDAAYRTLRDQPDGSVTISDILDAAGISTRSFYRHFRSKDELLCAMYRRDAEWAAAGLTTRVEGAESARAAVEAWIDEIFGFVRIGEKAERVTVFGSVVAERAEGIDEEARHAVGLLVAPLRTATVAGVEDESFTSPDPELDAELIAAAVFHAAGLASAARRGSYDQAAITAWCLRVLGATSAP